MLGRLRKELGRGRKASSPDGQFLIVGLGNPGEKYENTRHNLGFMVIDRISTRFPTRSTRTRFQSEIIESQIDLRKVVLAKPQTFMNLSGVAVGQLTRWYGIPLSNVLIVYDELDLPFGTLRLRSGGSAGGHNGVQSVIDQLGTQEFPRLRIGIGRPDAGATVPYVLSSFRNQETDRLPELLELACDAVFAWLRDGITVAMNEFNRRPVTVLHDTKDPS